MYPRSVSRWFRGFLKMVSSVAFWPDFWPVSCRLANISGSAETVPRRGKRRLETNNNENNETDPPGPARRGFRHRSHRDSRPARQGGRRIRLQARRKYAGKPSADDQADRGGQGDRRAVKRPAQYHGVSQQPARRRSRDAVAGPLRRHRTAGGAKPDAVDPGAD